ncbi:MAG: hypothetical protein J0I06_21105 [Planctomycetes bacterium]|nr:hypothetical protein [Planctomycetota bacterium]
MPVSGLVVSVASDDAVERVVKHIAGDGWFTVGERKGLRLAVAAHSDDRHMTERQHEWLRQLPGVVKVDVAFVYLDAAEAIDDR